MCVPDAGLNGPPMSPTVGSLRGGCVRALVDGRNGVRTATAVQRADNVRTLAHNNRVCIPQNIVNYYVYISAISHITHVLDTLVSLSAHVHIAILLRCRRRLHIRNWINTHISTIISQLTPHARQSVRTYISAGLECIIHTHVLYAHSLYV